MKRMVLATGNPGKVREMQAMLGPLGFEIEAQSRFDIPAAIENGDSFVANALIKARHAAAHTGLPALADDSGLAVDCLEGAPGIYSSRYAGENADDQANNAKLVEAMAGVPEEQRTASFHCAIALVHSADDPDPVICEARWAGWILEAPRGDKGFGYDPLFYIPELDRTSAELDPELKNRVSHRGQAIQKLIQSFHTLSVVDRSG